MTEPTDRTDPAAARPRRTVGNMDLQSAGLMELGRGVATSGGAALLLYQLLTGQMGVLARQIEDVGQEVDRLAERVERVSADVTSLRGDVIRLQAQTAIAQPQPHP